MNLRFILLLGAALIAMGCGEEEKKPVIEEKYQGNWQIGQTATDNNTPEAVPCMTANTNSQLFYASFDKENYTLEHVIWVGKTDCTGDNKISKVASGKLAEVDKSDSRQVFKIDGSESFKVTVKGDGAVTALNTGTVCGHTDWKAGEYNKESAHLKDCTDTNGGGYFNVLETAEEIQKTRIRLMKQGDGISISSTENEETTDEAFKAAGVLHWRKR